MAQLRSSHVVKQVAAGREFKGRPFTAKPETVVFKVCCDVCVSTKDYVKCPCNNSIKCHLNHYFVNNNNNKVM